MPEAIQLLRTIEDLKKTEVKDLVSARVREFESEKTDEGLFSELCFCILTANFDAERSIKIQEEIGKNFLTLTEPELASELKQLGHRFPNTRAKYIVGARRHTLRKIIDSFEGEELRDWLAKNVKGIGYKEASHFLRNIGFKNLAILDFHIIDVLVRNGLIQKPKLTREKYMEIEELLRYIAAEVNLNLAELDLYLWFAETGKVLK